MTCAEISAAIVSAQAAVDSADATITTVQAGVDVAQAGIMVAMNYYNTQLGILNAANTAKSIAQSSLMMYEMMHMTQGC